MMHLGRLRALREVADRGTIAAAADALHLTPSAVSQQLAALERDVGEPLLEPDGRSVRLTPVGRLLARRADGILAEVERLRADVDAHARGDAGEVRIGSFGTAMATLVAPVAGRLNAGGGEVVLRAEEVEAEEGFQRLESHDLDLVISMEAPGAPGHDDPRLHRVDLLADRLDALLPTAHPLADRRRIALGELAAEDWIAHPVGFTCEAVLLGGCRAAGFSPRIVHRSANFDAMIALCGAGLGVALIPRLSHAAPGPEDGAVLVPLAGVAPARHLFAACRRGAEGAPVLERVIGELRAQAEVEELRDLPAARVA